MRYNVILAILLITVFLSAIDQSELDEESLTSLFDHFRSNPININTASEYEIYSLPYIDEITASEIFDSISKSDRIKDLNNLVSEGIITDDIAKLLDQMIVYEEKGPVKNDLTYQFRTKRLLEKTIGYQDSNYLGNQSYYLNKIKVKTDNMQLSFLTEKEAGEISYTDNLKFSLEYTNTGSKIILGHFSFFSVTGLLQYESMFIDPFALKQSFKFQDPARSSLSSMDYYGFNGFYVSQEFRNSNIALFYGEKPVSVVLTSDNLINSVNLNSYTRTVNEIERYHNEKHFLKGISYQFIYNDLSSCISVSEETYSKELADNSELHSGILGEFQLKKKFKNNFIIQFSDATDLSKNNFILSSSFTSSKLKTGMYLSRIEKDRLSLSSQILKQGDGDKENSIGFKVKGNLYKRVNFIFSSNYFSSEYDTGYLPGGEVKAELDITNRNISLNCQSKYKNYEIYDDDLYSTINKIDSRLKIQYNFNRSKVSSYFKYSDWYDDGYGYLFSQTFTMDLSEGFLIRLGADVYFTQGSTIMYAGLYDIGLYPGLISYSGSGKSIYGFVSYSYRDILFTFGISEDSTSDSGTIGSGYDEIDSDRFHRIEFNVKYLSDLTSF
ncbi:MAG: hypothetical protein JXR69_02565 [Candidatus Delongbacteria bacterium]|nr:hypothetical protein [Candidatus Delongbacteria bacterium]